MLDSGDEEPTAKKAKVIVYDNGDSMVTNQCKRAAEEATEEIKRLRVSSRSPEDRLERGDAGDRDFKKGPKEDEAARRRQHFLDACESVSYINFSDHRRRFLLINPSLCAQGECEHKSRKEQDTCSEISSCRKETFRIDMKSQMWAEALHVCEVSITPNSILPPDVIMGIVEIILNVHSDPFSGYTSAVVIERCLFVLYLLFRTHPPCSQVVRKCYKTFLLSPLVIKPDSLSDRQKYDCDKGILKYILNRLESEMKNEANDGPLVDKDQHVTEEMKQSIRGLCWQKEKLDIFEALDRSERIHRLMTVLKGISELLTQDLSVWLSRHIQNQGTHIMRSHRPLLSILLWGDKILYTGSVNNNCRQIISLFVDIVSLGFPENDIRIITKLLNSIIQTFYMCETNSDTDYPHIGKYCSKLATEIYFHIKDMQPQSQIAVIQRIKPSFMRHNVAMLLIRKELQYENDNILMIFSDFLSNKTWEDFESKSPVDTKESVELAIDTEEPIELARKAQQIYLGFCMLKSSKNYDIERQNRAYPKRKKSGNVRLNEMNQKEIILLLLVALDAYFDAFQIEQLHEKLSTNKKTKSETNSHYSLSEEFYKKYRGICQDIKEVQGVLNGMKENAILDHFKGFRSLNILGL